MSKLVELRNKLAAKQKHMAEAWNLAGAEKDFSNSDFLAHVGATDAADAIGKVQGLDKELNDIFDELKPLAEMDSIEQRTAEIGALLTDPAGGPHLPGPKAGVQALGLGDLIVASDVFKAYGENGPSKGEIQGFGLKDLRATLMETASGWAPESVRSGRVVDAVTRPIEVLDIIPFGTTDEAAYVYMEETLLDHNAAELVEGGTYSEDAYELIDRTSAVRKIGTSIPVTDEQLADVAGIQSYLNNRMTFGLRQRLDSQVLNGNGTPPNLEGINNHSGIQTQAKGTDTPADAIHRGITLVRVTGRSNPNFIILNPNDWQDIRLERTSEGLYIWGSPQEVGPARMWGLPVVQASEQSEGTGLVADTMLCQLFERQGVDVQVGFVGTQFTEGKRTIRADLRTAFAIFRGAAFCQVTGI